MSKVPQVLVVGGGMAGSIAALSAQQQGAQVWLAQRSWGATALSAGALQLAYAPTLAPATASLATHLQAIVQQQPQHPYSVLGFEQSATALLAGYSLLQHALESSGLALPALQLDASPSWFASAQGCLQAAAAAFAPHTNLSPLPSGLRCGILNIPGAAFFAAERLRLGWLADAAALAWATPPQFEVVQARVGTELSQAAALGPHALAQACDNRVVLQALVRTVATQTASYSALLVPPIFGLQQVAATQRYLRDVMHCPVVEALCPMPSVAGVRLQVALQEALRAAGIAPLGAVARLTAQPTATPRFLAYLAEPSVDVATPQGFDAVILCSGRLLGGGLQALAAAPAVGCRESLLDLPLCNAAGSWPSHWAAPALQAQFDAAQPLLSLGVQVNAQLQPRLPSGVVRAWPGLYVAGMLLGGFDANPSGCADGVALASGYLAGQAAAQC